MNNSFNDKNLAEQVLVNLW